MKLAEALAKFTKCRSGDCALYASLRARHRARLIDARSDKKICAHTEEQQNRVREAVAFKRAFLDVKTNACGPRARSDPKLQRRS